MPHVFAAKEAIDAVRRQLKEGDGEQPPDMDGGALLRKLVSVESGGAHNTKKGGASNRMTLSDKEIVTQAKT